MVLCCIPTDIVQCSIPEILDTATAVKVFCSNPFCWQSGKVHPGCFFKWEDKVVRFLVGEDRNKGSTDQRVKSLLWTKQMWDLSLPANLTACKCGEGSLKRIFEEEELGNEVSTGGGEATITISSYSGLTEECQDEAKSDKDSVEGTWEVVSRTKQKKNSKINEIKAAVKKQRRNKQTSVKLTGSQQPKSGPDPPEGRRDSSGLIHCCSCKTVHFNLPDFIQHCKTGQHSKQVLGDVNNNGSQEEIGDLRREVDHLKKGLVQIMKQGLEKDMLATTDFDQFKESCRLELKKNSATLALLIEKFQGLEETCLKVDDDLAALSLLGENNEKDIDSCYDCCQDLTQNMTELTKELKSFKKNSLLAQDLLEVKINEFVESVPKLGAKIPQVQETKPMKAVSICNLAFVFFFLAVVIIGFLLGRIWH